MLLQKLLWLIAFMQPSFGGSGDSDGGAAQQKADEARKESLRARINALYGIGGGASTVGESGPLGGALAMPANPTSMDTTLARLKGEEDTLGNNYKEYYTNQGKDAYEEAERNLRFGAANRGAIGGTEYADEQAQLEKQHQLGSGRIADAVQQAINNLRAGRETNRLNAIGLVNSGSGEDAVQAASTGLKSSLDTVSAANKGNLFADLFQNLAFTKAAGDKGNSNAAALAALYGNKSPISFNTSYDTGRVQN